ncbi:fumarylacetoacetate hydrolase family protein [Streptomyces sp. S465]|uniref:fumarylacetoacetate hydrolase family protein n=1 Tax=Streptomyces sp. S465 TaxID=2979468 RepID=UPI0022A8C487|nr:fumarylacetoacetate hydrolase family protein [Streptomyces sp. S465]WAP55012.1 fumarylacetoacetate hydrolase family protein [Streptomyces sp. S465]
MRIGNVRGRPWLVTGTERGVDIHESSGGRLGPGFAELYDNWEQVVQWADSVQDEGVPFDHAQLGPPSPHPRQVFAVGLNYFDHVEEAGLAVPQEPSVFTKYVSSFAGAESTVELPQGSVDWEVEVVVIIARTARRVAARDAWTYVAGLTVGQDLSERGLQLTGAPAQYSLGKSFAGFGPTGPYLVSCDEFSDPGDLEMGCLVNGEPVQKARTSGMIFPISVLIEKLSQVTTLYPGDVIFTGTCAGVGAVRTPPRFLSPGDELVSYIEGIGSIRQRFVAAAAEGGSA